MWCCTAAVVRWRTVPICGGVHGHARYGFYESTRPDSSQRLPYGLDSDGLSRPEGEMTRARAGPGSVAASLAVQSRFALGWFLRLQRHPQQAGDQHGGIKLADERFANGQRARDRMQGYHV